MPIDRHGHSVLTSSGGPNVNIQPPCLLRYSPSMFAREVPSVFVHDEETNSLRLKDPQARYPWVSPKRGEWLYCADCFERWLSVKERTRVKVIPFRDKASQHNLKATWNQLKRRHEEHERDADHGEAPMSFLQQDETPDDVMAEDAPIFDVSPKFADAGGLGSQTHLEDGACDHAVCLPQVETPDGELEEPKVELAEQMEVERPSLDVYQAKWDNLLEHHSRSVDGPFSADNLCPSPVHQLWPVPQPCFFS